MSHIFSFSLIVFQAQTLVSAVVFSNKNSTVSTERTTVTNPSDVTVCINIYQRTICLLYPPSNSFTLFLLYQAVFFGSRGSTVNSAKSCIENGQADGGVYISADSTFTTSENFIGTAFSLRYRVMDTLKEKSKSCRSVRPPYSVEAS